jgi:hypothetical protein
MRIAASQANQPTDLNENNKEQQWDDWKEK